VYFDQRRRDCVERGGHRLPTKLHNPDVGRPDYPMNAAFPWGAALPARPGFAWAAFARPVP
jgi:hypothetical protein